MSVWRFPNLNAFQAALSALPVELLVRPVHAALVDGAVIVEADADLAPVGAVQAPSTPSLATCSCWAEVIPVHQTADPGAVAMALFVFEGEHTEAAALELASEMVRLGCDRQDLMVVHGNDAPCTVIRVSGPPYYTVLRALDGPKALGVRGALRAFVPAGQVWVEVGHSHALSGSLRVPPGSLWLLPGSGPWTTLPDGPWTPLDARLDLVLGGIVPEPAVAPTRRLSVPLRLGRAPSKPAGFWISEDPDAVDRLLQELPEAIANQLELAVLPAAGAQRERVLFRTRRLARGTRAMPELPGRAFAAAETVPGLFLPVGTAIEPPVRSDRLRALLAPPEGSVAWVEQAERGLQVHFVMADRFVPLDEWVDYLLDRDANVLEAWVQGTQFAFDGLRISADPAAPAPTPDRKPRERKARPEATSVPVAVEPEPAAARAPARRTQAIRVDLTPDAAARAVEAAERAFLDLQAPGDAPDRGAMWADLAALYTQVGRTRDAGLAWGRAVWADEADAVPFQAAMQAAHGPPAALLELPDPNREQVRAVAAAILVDGVPQDLTRPWLDRHGHVLDLRTWWLTQTRLAHVHRADRDVLLLARARDRVFSDLQHGLPAARELPAFLRFSGVGTASRLGDPLERMRTQFFTIKRTRHALEAPVALTRVYVDLVFAWGFARLGVVDRAADLRAQALAALPPAPDPIHTFCSNGLAARVSQAIDGEPAGVPLPPAIAQQLNHLVRFDRYKVDRLRQACTILEPQEHLDPFRGFTIHEVDPRGEVFASLRGMVDTELLAAALSTIIDDSRALPEQQAARLYDGVLDFLPALAPARLIERLTTVIAAVSKFSPAIQAPLAAEALAVASMAREAEQVRLSSRLVLESFALLGASHPTVAQHLPGVLRSFRRAGRTEDARPLLETLLAGAGPIARGEDLVVFDAVSPRGRSPRLSLAAGLLAIGSPAEAAPAFDAAWSRLGQDPPLPERLALARGISRAQAFATPEAAVETALRLFRLTDQVSDGYGTHSHFAISLVEYAECLVQSLAHEELSLGARGRALIEEDEFLLRQRVHRDLAV